MCRGELSTVITWLCLSACEAAGGSAEELNRYIPPSPAVFWVVNVRERKPRQKKIFLKELL